MSFLGKLARKAIRMKTPPLSGPPITHKRTDIINAIIKTFKMRSYLEIGVNDGVNINSVNCPTRTGVDPMGMYALPYDSDEYFRRYSDKYDCVFIDGLHHYDQVYRDIVNSLDRLNEGGVIVCHDMYPTSKEMQRVPQIQDEWTGDCWRAWLQLRHGRGDLTMMVVNADYGVGIIRKGEQIVLDKDYSGIAYEEFSINAKQLLNLISYEEFHAWLEKTA